MRTGHKHLKHKETNIEDKERTPGTTRIPLVFYMVPVLAERRKPRSHFLIEENQ